MDHIGTWLMMALICGKGGGGVCHPIHTCNHREREGGRERQREGETAREQERETEREREREGETARETEREREREREKEKEKEKETETETEPGGGLSVCMEQQLDGSVIDVPSGAWCFVENPEYAVSSLRLRSLRAVPQYIIELCDIPECGFEPSDSCQHLQDKGTSYNGPISTSRIGNECVAWSKV